MANSPYPPYHPRSRRQAPLTMSEHEFARAFPSEGELIEFKTGVGRDAIHRTVTAFSNTDGGVLLIGVDDEGHVVGKALTLNVESDLTRAIVTIHNPGRFWLYEVEVGGRVVTIVGVAARSQGFAQTSDGQIMVRRGAHSMPLIGAELLHFLQTRTLARFDATSTDVPLEGASPELVEEIRGAYRWRRATIDERLKNERLVADEEGSARLTVAGALTLLPDPAAALGKTFVEVLRYPDESVDYDRRIEVRGPVQVQVSATAELVMDELGTDLVVTGTRRTELPKLPEVVLREAIANAVAHRNYEELGRAIRIELRPGRVVVESPGGLPEPVTEENIRETQSARNLNVIRVLRRLGLAEDSGRGVDVMQDSMAEALLDPPEFHDLGHSVRVTLPITGAITPQERAWILEVERRGGIAPRDRILVVHAARGEELTNESVRDLLGVDSRDARRALKRLTASGFLEQVGERGGAYYVLSVAVGAPAAFRLSPAALKELVVSLAEGAELTNAIVRGATGLDRAEALRVLDSLVAEGRLLRRGERRGAHYVLP